MSVTSRVVTAAWCVLATGAERRFRAAVATPERAQEQLRAGAARRVAGTAWGRAHDIDAFAHAARSAWRSAVPLGDYEAFRPWIDRIAAGEPDVLTPGRPLYMEPTGGTSGATKLIPVTRALLAEFAAATTPWIRDLALSHPNVRRGRAYWAISPPGQEYRRMTTGGIAVGVPADSDYLPPVLARLVESTLGVPTALARIVDLDASRYVTLLALLAMDDLALVSVWSPSFLTILARHLDAQWPRLLADLRRGTIHPDVAIDDPQLRIDLTRTLGAHPRRAAQLTRTFGLAQAPTDLGRVWPNLAIVSCWCDALAERALPAMRERVPHVRVQPKGLLATEGITTIPRRDQPAPVLAVGSHLVELLPTDISTPTGCDVVDAWDCDPGMRAEVVLTTAGGLTRYRTRDVVEVVGHVPGTRTPLVRFVGRADHASDIAGEKLTPDAVSAAFMAAGIPGSALVYADYDSDPPGYVLLADGHAGDAHAAAQRLEAVLREHHHYELCRRLGQLAPLRPHPVSDAVQVYDDACRRLGQRAGSRKDAALDPRPTLAAALACAVDEREE